MVKKEVNSIDIVGFIVDPEEWAKKKDVWVACEKAGIEPPEEVLKFFDKKPGDCPQRSLIYDDKVAIEWSNDVSCGYDIKVFDIPKDIVFLRFHNSWHLDIELDIEDEEDRKRKEQLRVIG